MATSIACLSLDRVRVGVIDSGWDRTVSDPRVAPGISFVGRGAADGKLGSADDHDRIGHGTSCADIILRHSDAEIVPIRVFGRRLETSPAVIIWAIDWAVDIGLPLVNLSLGTTRSDALQPLYAACERARRSGVIVVAADRASGSPPSFPAIFEPVIGVTIGNVQTAAGVIYRHDEPIECAAAGIAHDIRGLGGVRRTVTGTSFAAPVVTAAIARMLVPGQRITLEAIRKRIASVAAISA